MPKTKGDPPPRKRGRPPASQEAGRDQIKKAALVEFARQGFKGTSIDQIAARAGVAKPLVHYHYGSKANLWKTAVSDAFDAFRTEVIVFGMRVSHEAPEAVLGSFAEKLVRMSAERPYLVQIAIDETRQRGERSEWLKETYLVPLHHIMIQVLSLISPNNPDVRTTASHLVPSLFGAVNFPYIDRDVLQDAYGADVFSETYIKEQTRVITLLMHASLDDDRRRHDKAGGSPQDA